MKTRVIGNNVIVSIDVGTTKICVLVAQQIDAEHIELIGMGKSVSDGLKKGVVVDVARTVNSIKNAVKEAELTSGISIESAYVGISGGHIGSLNSQGMVPIKGGQVRPFDISNVMDAAKAVCVVEGHYMLHILPQYYVIDGGDRIADPLGMHGLRLEVQAHIITGAISSAQNLMKCVEMAGVKVQDIILEQLASADAVLSADERELGIGMLDIGGGTSDFALYQHGSIRHTMVLPVAGNHFTNDIAIGLRTTIKEAERIKREFGLAYAPLMTEDVLFEVLKAQGNDTHIFQRSDLINIIQPRATEILALVKEDIVSRGLTNMMTAGLVLTGGGSLLNGMPELARHIFSLPVRIGYPQPSMGIIESLASPMYATGYGLLLQALKKRNQTLSHLSGPSIRRIFVRMKSWIGDFF